MKDELISTLTERGQVSFPASLRRKASLRPGQRISWTQISPTEFRVNVLQEKTEIPGPFGMLGYAKNKYRPGDTRTSDEIMADLREGEREDSE